MRKNGDLQLQIASADVQTAICNCKSRPRACKWQFAIANRIRERANGNLQLQITSADVQTPICDCRKRFSLSRMQFAAANRGFQKSFLILQSV